MKTLYEQHKSEWDRIEADGFRNIVMVAKKVATLREMDGALGYERGASRHWVNGGNASRASDHRARLWLGCQAEVAAPSQQPIPAPQGILLLIACPAGTEEKARKLLAFIGCDVTEV